MHKKKKRKNKSNPNHLDSRPSGFKPALSSYPSVFDKEALLDDDKELWLIRIPDNVQLFYNLKFMQHVFLIVYFFFVL